jgi:hypothetical protein
MEVGCVVMGFHRFIKDHAPLVIAMRNIMRPRRGSKKRTDVDGVMMTWGEYCLKFYGVGHDWVNRMLKGEHTQDTPEVEDMDEESVDATEGVEQTESKKPSRKVIEKGIINLNKRLDEAHAEMAEKDAEVFKTIWQGFLSDIPLPPDFEIKVAVRRLPLEDLNEGIESYAAKISQIEGKEVKRTPTTKNAMNYVCGTAWKIVETENPNQKFHATARRQRNAQRDPNSPHWDGEAFGNATPQERQRIMAETIAKQKAKGVQ